MDLLSIMFLLSHGANAIFASILIIVSFRLYSTSGIDLVLLMIILMTSWAVTNFLLIVPLIFGLGVENEGVELIASWNVIGSAIVPSVFIIFIDAFEGEIDTKKVAVAIATIAVCIFIVIMGWSENGDISLVSTIVIPRGTDLVTMRWSPITSLAIFPTVIACGIWTLRELSLAKKNIIDPFQKKQMRYMTIGGILMFFIGPFFGIIGVVLVDGFQMDVAGTWASEIIGYMFVSIGTFMIALAYITSNEVAFLQPQRIDTMMVIQDTGVPVLSYDFSPQTDKTEVSLVSGAITAITALMGEAFNVKSDIKEIVFFDKELLLEFRQFNNQQQLAFILITDRKSTFLESSTKRFADNFIGEISGYIEDGKTLSKEQNKEAISLLRTSFGLTAEERV